MWVQVNPCIQACMCVCVTGLAVSLMKCLRSEGPARHCAVRNSPSAGNRCSCLHSSHRTNDKKRVKVWKQGKRFTHLPRLPVKEVSIITSMSFPWIQSWCCFRELVNKSLLSMWTYNRRLLINHGSCKVYCRSLLDLWTYCHRLSTYDHDWITIKSFRCFHTAQTYRHRHNYVRESQRNVTRL